MFVAFFLFILILAAFGLAELVTWPWYVILTITIGPCAWISFCYDVSDKNGLYTPYFRKHRWQQFFAILLATLLFIVIEFVVGYIAFS